MFKITERPNKSRRVQIEIRTPSRTKTEFQAQTDVNNIMKKYLQTNDLTLLNRKNGLYADVSAIGDLQSSLEQVQKAGEAFQSLPAAVRRRFQNDPAELVSFMQDPDNYDEGVRIGLYEPRPSETAQINDDSNDDKKTQTKAKANSPKKTSTPPTEE